ncbi:MAG: hypothetical protein MJ217_00575 [Bacilli bacterium]|nr:hypothetical protein [Bacilli bacterium]
MFEYGLIGKNVEKSYSKQIYKILDNVDYSLLSFPDEKSVTDFIKNNVFKGVNITIPYKKVAKECCSSLSKEAEKTDAVNLVIKNENTLKGHNTDVYGFSYLLDRNGIKVKGLNCLILGTGATSRTVEYVLKAKEAKSICFMSRNKRKNNIYSYNDKNILESIDLIVNTTPIYGENLINFVDCKSLKYFVDVVYNPIQTQQMISAQDIGARSVGGLQMLIAQAVRSSELYFNKVHESYEYDDLYKKTIVQNANIVLIGHPFSGKSAIGYELAKSLNLKFLDLDEEIVKLEGKPIDKIFTEHGESYFRSLESKLMHKYSNELVGYIISLGGGSILSKESFDELRKKSIVINLVRDINLVEKESLKNRPLVHDIEDLKSIIRNRENLYKNYSNFTVKNNSTIKDAVDMIERLL